MQAGCGHTKDVEGIALESWELGKCPFSRLAVADRFCGEAIGVDESRWEVTALGVSAERTLALSGCQILLVLQVSGEELLDVLMEIQPSLLELLLLLKSCVGLLKDSDLLLKILKRRIKLFLVHEVAFK